MMANLFVIGVLINIARTSPRGGRKQQGGAT
jgi:hypothetical protein